MKIRISNIIFVFIASLYFLSCDKEVSVTPPEAPAPQGFFSVNSNPKGAEIFLNNKRTGRFTPDSLSYMSAGKYNIKLSLPLYRDTSLSININEKNRENIFVDFNANPAMYGAIMCTSVPNHASVFIDGKPTNSRTPVTFNKMLPGVYTIGFKSFGCRDDSIKITLKSSQTPSASIVLQDTTIWLTYNKSNSKLPSDNLTCIAIDGLGTKWIGTRDEGLVSFDGVDWKAYNPSNSDMPSYNVTSLSIRYSYVGTTLYQTIYIGTTKGLAILVNGKFYTFNTTNSLLPDDYINSVSVDRYNFLWIATMKGLALIPDNWNKWEVFNKAKGSLPEDWISQVSATDSYTGHHEVWVGTSNNGIAFFDYTNKKWTYYSKPSSALPSNLINALKAASPGSGVWFGCNADNSMPGGFGCFLDNKWNSYPVGSSKNVVESIFPLGNSAWVCTKEGLFLIGNSGVQTVYNMTNSGLPSNQVKYLAMDSDGHLWIATSFSGLVYYKLK